MKQIPDPEYAPVLRTDYSNEDTWQTICALIQKPVAPFGFRAFVEFIDDAEFADLSRDQLLERISKDYNHSFIMIVDRTAISGSEHPLLIVDLFEASHAEFRAIPAQIQSIENNLSIGNMDFEDFSSAVDENGIFRGFPR